MAFETSFVRCLHDDCANQRCRPRLLFLRASLTSCIPGKLSHSLLHLFVLLIPSHDLGAVFLVVCDVSEVDHALDVDCLHLVGALHLLSTWTSLPRPPPRLQATCLPHADQACFTRRPLDKCCVGSKLLLHFLPWWLTLNALRNPIPILVFLWRRECFGVRCLYPLLRVLDLLHTEALVVPLGSPRLALDHSRPRFLFNLVLQALYDAVHILLFILGCGGDSNMRIHHSWVEQARCEAGLGLYDSAGAYLCLKLLLLNVRRLLAVAYDWLGLSAYPLVNQVLLDSLHFLDLVLVELCFLHEVLTHWEVKGWNFVEVCGNFIFVWGEIYLGQDIVGFFFALVGFIHLMSMLLLVCVLFEATLYGLSSQFPISCFFYFTDA